METPKIEAFDADVEVAAGEANIDPDAEDTVDCPPNRLPEFAKVDAAFPKIDPAVLAIDGDAIGAPNMDAVELTVAVGVAWPKREPNELETEVDVDTPNNGPDELVVETEVG